MSHEYENAMRQVGTGFTDGIAKPLPLVVVAAGIVWRKGRFLAAQRPADKPLDSYWEFPGGKLEENETLEQALYRELAEELGIGVQACTLWQAVEHSYTERGFHAQVHFFHVTAFTGEPCANERQNLRWVTPEEALTLGFLPADTVLLPQLVGMEI